MPHATSPGGPQRAVGRALLAELHCRLRCLQVSAHVLVLELCPFDISCTLWCVCVHVHDDEQPVYPHATDRLVCMCTCLCAAAAGR